ncbi:MAG: YfcE family phosphodiesterase [Proteobacteria bacterium]|nr:YfcE family phosphodiesterase [Pseudomonadota bacterium]
MRIGVVSDTHDQLRNVRRIVELFNRAGVDRVVHTGDITRAPTLEIFAELSAPMTGVYGNNDVERDALDAAAAAFGCQLSDPPLELAWSGRDILVVHDPAELQASLKPDHVLVLHGHTHRHEVVRSNGRLVFNPGECAGHLEGHNRIGVVDLESLDLSMLRF